MGAARRAARGAGAHRGVVSIAAGQDCIPAVVEAIRAGYQAQRVGDYRLLQGRAGDTDHVRTAEKDLTELNVDHEIIFVNDCSPDDSEEVIRAISRNDRRVMGISHSRNFGSQAAFRSGMEIATKNSCVLLDGDLQDPPELIEQFVAKWREGFDVVYGRRVKREAPLPMQIAYKLFYRVFDTFSYIKIPRDAGDFSLIDRRVMEAMLRFPERDLFCAEFAPTLDFARSAWITCGRNGCSDVPPTAF